MNVRRAGPSLEVLLDGVQVRVLQNGAEVIRESLLVSAEQRAQLCDFSRELQRRLEEVYRQSGAVDADYDQAVQHFWELEVLLGKRLAGLLFGWMDWFTPGAGADSGATEWPRGNSLLRLLEVLLERTTESPYLRLILRFKDPVLVELPWELLRWPLQENVRLATDERLTLVRGHWGPSIVPPFPFANAPLPVLFARIPEQGEPDPFAASRQAMFTCLRTGLEPLGKEGAALIRQADFGKKEHHRDNSSSGDNELLPGIVHLPLPVSPRSDLEPLLQQVQREVMPGLAPALLFLQPCFTASPVSFPSVPITGAAVAGQMLEAGCRAVIMNATPFRRLAAPAMVEAFYTALGMRASLDYAVQTSRRVLERKTAELGRAMLPDHWFRPVLTIHRAADLNIFNPVTVIVRLETPPDTLPRITLLTEDQQCEATIQTASFKEGRALIDFYAGLGRYAENAPLMAREVGRSVARLMLPRPFRSVLEPLRRRAQATKARIDLEIDLAPDHTHGSSLSRTSASSLHPVAAGERTISNLEGLWWEALALPPVYGHGRDDTPADPMDPLTEFLRLGSIEHDSRPLLIDEDIHLQRAPDRGRPLPPPGQGPLLVLVAAWPGSSSAPTLLKRSLRALKDGLVADGWDGQVQLELLYGPSVADLRRRLTDPALPTCHVVHLAGPPVSGVGSSAVAVASSVADALRDVRLVTVGTFVSDEAAYLLKWSSTSRALDSAEAAVTLVRAGVPRAIGLSRSGDPLIGRLMRRLARGESLHDAISGLRRRLYAKGHAGSGGTGRKNAGAPASAVSSPRTSPESGDWFSPVACGGPWEGALVLPPAGPDPDFSEWLRCPYGLGTHPTGVRLERDLDLLRAEWVLSRPGLQLVLQGPPGIGKTMLAAHLCQSQSRRGLTPLVHRGSLGAPALVGLVQRALQCTLEQSESIDRGRVEALLLALAGTVEIGEALALIYEAWAVCRVLVVLEDFHTLMAYDPSARCWTAGPEMSVQVLAALMTVETRSRFLIVSRLPLPEALRAANLVSMPLVPLDLASSTRLLSELPHVWTGDPKVDRARAERIFDRLDGMPGAFACLERVLAGDRNAGFEKGIWPSDTAIVDAVDADRFTAALEMASELVSRSFEPLLAALTRSEKRVLRWLSVVRGPAPESLWRGLSGRSARQAVRSNLPVESCSDDTPGSPENLLPTVSENARRAGEGGDDPVSSVAPGPLPRLEVCGLLLRYPGSPDSLVLPRILEYRLRPSPAVHHAAAIEWERILTASLDGQTVPLTPPHPAGRYLPRSMAASWGRPEPEVPSTDVAGWLEARHHHLITGQLDRAGQIEVLLHSRLSDADRRALALELQGAGATGRTCGEAWIRAALASHDLHEFQYAIQQAIAAAHAAPFDNAADTLATQSDSLHAAEAMRDATLELLARVCLLDFGVPRFDLSVLVRPDIEPMEALRQTLNRARALRLQARGKHIAGLRAVAARVIAETAWDYGLIDSPSCLRDLEARARRWIDKHGSARARVDLHYARFVALLEEGKVELAMQAADEACEASGTSTHAERKVPLSPRAEGGDRPGPPPEERLKGLYAGAMLELLKSSSRRDVVDRLNEVRRLSALSGRWTGELRCYYALMCFYRKTGELKTCLEIATPYLLLLRRHHQSSQEMACWAELLAMLEALCTPETEKERSGSELPDRVRGGPYERSEYQALTRLVCAHASTCLRGETSLDPSLLESLVDIAFHAHVLGAGPEAVGLADAIIAQTAEYLSQADARRLSTLPLEQEARDRLKPALAGRTCQSRRGLSVEHRLVINFFDKTSGRETPFEIFPENLIGRAARVGRSSR